MAADRLRQSVAPAYLFVCLLLGGSAQGVWVNLVLQLLAVLLLAWAAVASPQQRLTGPGRQVVILIGVALLVIVIQVVPLPPLLWGALPGRGTLIDGYAILGQAPPWLPVAVSPASALDSVVRLLPAAAMLAVMLRLQAYRPAWIALAAIAGALGGVMLGALQVTGGGQAFYLYPIANFGSATGFFANSNHMASLLVAAVPFLFALMVANRAQTGKGKAQRRTSANLVLIGAAAVVLLGLGLNGSLAGFGLIVPVMIASALLLVGWRRQRRWLALPAVLLVGAVIGGLVLPISGASDRYGAGASVETRREVNLRSWSAATDYLPFGSGLGSFEKVYGLHEDPAAVDRTFVNHAHNDYLEILLELGLPGVVLVLLFLVWWARTAVGRWRDNLSDPFAKAAVIVSAALLAHSLVDFPLRTGALSALFAAVLALLAAPNRVVTGQRPDLRPTRHLEIR